MVHGLHSVEAMPHPTPAPCWKLAVLFSWVLVPGISLASEAVTPDDRPFQRTEPPRSFQQGVERIPRWQERLSGKHSSLSGVLLGASIGAFAGGVISLPAGVGDLAPILIPAGAVVGALIGYGLSDDGSASSRVQPLVAVSPRSAALGLGGRF
jgi:hypothetical protein